MWPLRRQDNLSCTGGLAAMGKQQDHWKGPSRGQGRQRLLKIEGGDQQ
jgi:hypothetical protein